MDISENKKCPKCSSSDTSIINFGEMLLIRCNDCDSNFSM